MEAAGLRILRAFQGLLLHESLVVQYLGVLKVNLWDYKGNIFTQKG